ncbi:MAG: acetate kinase [Clostridia bacterium]|nr:acetate kinase [Clostridia bacterium]
MKILVINAGSSSLKYQLINMDGEIVLCKGAVERIGLDGSFLKHKADKVETKLEKTLKDHKDAIAFVLETITSSEYGVIKSLDEINGVGHRVLHGGEACKESALINDDVMKVIYENTPLGPLHMPANIMGIEAVQKVAPNMPNVAVFDTAFHANMPKYAYMYALPKKAYTDYKVRRYGFHGTSHYYVASRLASLENKDIKDLKIITCHLGNGSSISAVNGGISVDTSMGFTPLEGLIMGTRCGDLDPAVQEYLMNQTGWDIKKVTSYLNKESGLLGVSGISSDMRDLLEVAKTNTDAKLALDMLSYGVKKYIGAYAAVMGGVDAIVFTAGVGEYTPEIRLGALNNMEFLGIVLDAEKNENAPRGKEYKISSPNSKVAVYIIPTNEELVIARDTQKIVDEI